MHITPIPICEASSPLDIYGNFQFYKSQGYKNSFGVFARKKLASIQGK